MVTENVHSPTYDEMIGSGRFWLIRHAAMRKFIVGYYARRHVQTSRTANRITSYGNMVYRHAPPQLMSIDQLASDAGLSPYVNAELSFAYFLEREVRENRAAAEEFRTALRVYLDTGEVTVTEWQLVG